ncbi:ATP-binding protein [Geothrix sp. 21YS21S-4]|uniref:sensor histidine kinase n=1 Tax=Geothrix sp. 21YS21S-4 TaxID=3068889 RepID=UPI0027B957CD|nr:ATP-binding protein [Geothrix sp. 21YS21S-4]
MYRLSLKTKLSAVISLLVLLFVAFDLLYYPPWVRRQIRSQAELSARQVAETASYALGPAMNAGRATDIRRVLQGVQHLPAFRFSAVYDSEGQPLDLSSTTPAWAGDYLPQDGLSHLYFRAGSELLVAAGPVFYEGPRGPRTGGLILGFTTEDTQRAVRETIRVSLAVGLLALGVGIGAAVFLSNRYLRPVIQLTKAAQKVAQGNLEAVSVEVYTRDEVQDLSRSFALMTDKLRVSRDEIERQNRLLEYRVQERTRQLMETIWELEEARTNLEHVVQERTKGLERTQAELRAWATTLEEKVEEKTRELREVNDDLLTSYEQLKEVDRLKDEFLANMSHELRTPLNAIIGFSGMLMQNAESRLDPEAGEDLRIIYQNGRSLLGLIDSILDLSKIEAGKMELELEGVDPVALLDEVKAMAAGLVQDRPLALSYARPDAPVRVLGDRNRLRQVFTNLVGNAVKFTEAGSVRISTEITDSLFRVFIEDTGIGMSDEELGRLFKPFQQVDGGITRRFGGTGLGLAISQRFMRLMKGRIRAASKKGEGSTFVVEMPLAPEGLA